jgi:hypothetical protein
MFVPCRLFQTYRHQATKEIMPLAAFGDFPLIRFVRLLPCTALRPSQLGLAPSWLAQVVDLRGFGPPLRFEGQMAEYGAPNFFIGA